MAKPREKEDAMRLNKYIAHSGICSRREADTMISDGKVSINGSVITELGTTVNIGDLVEVNGQKVYPEPYVYIMIYKPRDTITTTSDEKGRKTVMDLVERATGNGLPGRTAGAKHDRCFIAYERRELPTG